MDEYPYFHIKEVRDLRKLAIYVVLIFCCVGFIGCETNKKYYAVALPDLNEKELKEIEKMVKVEEIVQNINLIIFSSSQELPLETVEYSNVKKVHNYIKSKNRNSYEITLKEKDKHFLKELKKIGHVLSVTDKYQKNKILIEVVLTQNQYKNLKNNPSIEEISLIVPPTIG